MGSHDKTKETDMSAWTDKLIATYTLAQIQDQAKQLGIKNVKKFTKEGLALEIELKLESSNSETDDKTKEQDMNENTETVEVTAIEGSPEELIAMLNDTAAVLGTTPTFESEELENILEDSVADVPGENETEVAPKLTDDYIKMLDAVRENAAKRKHMMWNTIIAKAENEPLAQIAGKANTVRGILWKIGKHLEPMIEAFDKQEALNAAKAAEAAEAAAEAKMGE